MKSLHPIYLFTLFFASFSFSQNLPTNISFNNNSWIESGSGTFHKTGNEYEITATSGSPKISLDVPVANTYSEFYITAEIKLENVVYGSKSWHSPKIRINDGGTTNSLITENFLNYPDGSFQKIGVSVKNYDELTNNSIRIEFSFQNSSGTMTIKNPMITNIRPAMEYSFPFAVPSNPSYNLSINTGEKHKFNNDLLSTNSHFRFLSNTGFTWGSPETKEVLSTWFPQTNIRFPGGTVGNFYDWNNDGYHNPDIYPDVKTNSSSERGFMNDYKYGFEDYKEICLTNNASSTLMFTVNFDDLASLRNRLVARIASNLDITWIEMGNENYHSSGQIGNISDVTSYITFTENLTSALKLEKPDIKVAINLDKDDYLAGSWNEAFFNKNYFDATIIHNYNNTNASLYSGASVYIMMNSYKITEDRMNLYNQKFPGIPTLLTEWCVLSEDIPATFTQTLASADSFLAIEKAAQQGIVAQAGIHMLWKNNAYSGSTLTYHNGSEMVLTSLGVMYASLFDVFKDNQVFDAFSSGPELEAGLEGLYAKATDNGLDYKLYVVNKLPVTSSLNFTINGIPYDGDYSIETYTEDINVELTNPYTNKASAWNSSTLNTSDGNLAIPAYSINVVSINKASLSLNNNQKIEIYFRQKNNRLIIYGVPDNEFKLTIYNTLGKEIIKTTFKNENELNLDSFAKGIYILKIQSQNTQKTSKIIIE